MGASLPLAAPPWRGCGKISMANEPVYAYNVKWLCSFIVLLYRLKVSKFVQQSLQADPPQFRRLKILLSIAFLPPYSLMILPLRYFRLRSPKKSVSQSHSLLTPPREVFRITQVVEPSTLAETTAAVILRVTQDPTLRCVARDGVILDTRLATTKS